MSKQQSNKDTKDKHKWVPDAVKQTEHQHRTSKKGNTYVTWTEAWFKGAIRGGLREVFHQWPRRKEVLERVRLVEPTLTKKGIPSKRPTVWYLCEQCNTKCKAQVAKGNPKKYVRIWVDHIDPVVPIGVDIGFDEYIQRLFCDPKNLQALCDKCHKDKTNKERSERMRVSKTGKSTATWRR